MRKKLHFCRNFSRARRSVYSPFKNITSPHFMNQRWTAQMILSAGASRREIPANWTELSWIGSTSDPLSSREPPFFFFSLFPKWQLTETNIGWSRFNSINERANLSSQQGTFRKSQRSLENEHWQEVNNLILRFIHPSPVGGLLPSCKSHRSFQSIHLTWQ